MAVRILVVGSTGDNANLARKTLVPLECEVAPATSISLGLYLAHKTLPDLIVADTAMVDGTGLDLLREVKADKELSEIPFVLMCEAADRQLKEAVLSLGADQVIDRPQSEEHFLAAVKPYLHERRHERPEESPE